MPHASLSRTGWWHWLPALLVLVAGVAGTLATWMYSSRQVHDLAQERFMLRTDTARSDLLQQVDTQVGLLMSLRNLVEQSPRISRRNFELAMGRMDIERVLPAISNIQLIRSVEAGQLPLFESQTASDPHLNGALPLDFAVHPRTSLPRYLVTDFVWPPAGHEALLGQELHALPEVLQGAERAIAEGQAAATAALPGKGGARIMVFMPLDHQMGGREGEAGSAGLVALTVDMSTLLAGLAGPDNFRGLSFSLSDHGLAAAPDADASHVLVSYGDTAWNETVGREVLLPVEGRLWQLRFMPEAGLLSRAEGQRPLVNTGITGLITLVIAAWMAYLGLRRQRAQEQAATARQALQENEAKLQAVFEHAPVGISQSESASGRRLYVNPALCAILGYSAQELMQAHFQAYTHPDDLSRSMAMRDRMLRGEIDSYQMEKRYLRKDGKTIWANLRMVKIPGTACHVSVISDITETKHAQDALARSEQRYREMFNQLPVGVSLVDQDEIRFINHRFTHICGYAAHEAPNVDAWWRAVMPDEQERERVRGQWRAARAAADLGDEGAIGPIEFALTAKGGIRRHVELSGMALGSAHIAVLVDQTQRRQAEQQIAYLAQTDVLTGLANRSALQDGLRKALAQAAQGHSRGALLMLGIDGFKAINETSGHEVGDRLLALVARRLLAGVPAGALVARHGGDVYAVVLPRVPGDADGAAAAVQALAQALMQAASQPCDLEQGQLLRATLGIGVAVFDGSERSADELLKRSDMALYAAKAQGRGELRFFTPQMQAQVAERVQLETDMRKGLEAGQFELFYQPKAEGDRIIGAEALVRWRHPQRGMVPPAQFIALAEETGLILPLGDAVMRMACEQLAHWAGHPVLGRLTVSVNVSALQFRQAQFAPRLLALLAQTGAPTRAIKLELTESMLLQDTEGTITRMRQLKEYGVSFSLDDFGTGYSSLSYLKRLPLDELKIDQSFVRHVLTDPNEAAIARTIIALGASLGLDVVAEGVETEEQRAFLQSNGCDLWQGYLLSPPVAADDYEALVLERSEPVSQWGAPL
ncbi:bifunctional diguanylate cyclase/phosphodiesterase [Comamonas badia]|uniref:bifunctional diguanylate cyclase/phosphodiesterase n=1 Tax=Comamonas badia TaxID=265291 RepID=UPI0004661422|nr:EAL domain-containing protein [Comamonas badia]